MSRIRLYCPQCRQRRWMRQITVHGRHRIILVPGRDDGLRERWADLPLSRHLTTHDVEIATGEPLMVLECETCADGDRGYAWCYIAGEEMMLAVSKSS